MMWCITSILILLGAAQAGRRPSKNECCPLCDYVFRDDGTYSYTFMHSHNHSEQGPPVTSYWINMTSQRWKDESWTNSPLWWHYLVINVPDQIRFHGYGFLIVSNRTNIQSVPDFASDHVKRSAHHAAVNGIVTGAVYMIPNEPLVFTDDPDQMPLLEDDIIAHTWVEFMEQVAKGDCADPEVVLRMPMCKAVVKAMDTIDIFVQHDLNLPKGVNKFMLAGSSKRGWTTWLTGSIDDRVIAMAPMVLTSLNLQPNFHHYFMSFGGWPLWLFNYWVVDVFGKMDLPPSLELFEIIDAFNYRQWMDFPKLVVSATSDEFFLLDDTHYWWDDMPGEKHLWLLENSGHSRYNSPVKEELWTMLETFYLAVITIQETKITWKRVAPKKRKRVGSITLYSETKPLKISSFSALSVVPERRDWRRSVKCDATENCLEKPTNITWTENTQIQDNGDGSYYVEYKVPPKEDGFLAFYMRMEYKGPEGRTFVFSTEANIIPSYFPFDDCTGANCTGILK